MKQRSAMAEENKSNQEPSPKASASFTRIQRLKEKCRGTLKFSFIFFSALHVSTIVIAAIYYKKCPVEPEIPKYVLTIGILGVITRVIALFKDCLIKHMKITPILSFIMTAELAVFIVGSYYVYREYEPDYNPLHDRYCNKTLYMFSFIYITIIYCLILLCILTVGCFLFGLVLLDKYGPKHVEHDAGRTT